MTDETERGFRAERYRKQLIQALEELRPGHGFGPEPIYLANLLFGLLKYGCGEGTARQIFMKQGRPPERREKQEIENWLLLHMHDVQQENAETAGKKFYVMQFVKDYAVANKRRPLDEKRGAGGTDAGTLYQHLRTLLRERREAAVAADLQRARSDHAHAQEALTELQEQRQAALHKAND